MKKIGIKILLVLTFQLFVLACVANIKAKHINPLKELLTKIEAEPQFRKSLNIKEYALLKEFYENNKFELQWFSSTRDRIKRNELIEKVSHAEKYAVDKSYYKKNFIFRKKLSSKNDTLLAEIKFTDLAIYFLKDLEYSHQRFVNYNKGGYHPDCIAITYLLQEGLDKGNLENCLQTNESESQEYQQLKQLYNGLNNASQANEQKLKKINTAINWSRWISCMQYKSYLEINLATKKLRYVECNEELFTSNIDAGDLPVKYTATSSIKHIKFYFDGNYPLLQFDLNDKLPISLSSYSLCVPKDDQNYFIKIEKSGEFAELLGIDKEIINKSACLEEATPFVKIPTRFIPLFIINVDMNFK